MCDCCACAVFVLHLALHHLSYGLAQPHLAHCAVSRNTCFSSILLDRVGVRSRESMLMMGDAGIGLGFKGGEGMGRNREATGSSAA